MEEQQGLKSNQPPTHFAVPVKVFEAVVKTLSGLPYDQVSNIMQALQQCQVFSATPKEPPSEATPGLKSA